MWQCLVLFVLSLALASMARHHRVVGDVTYDDLLWAGIPQCAALPGRVAQEHLLTRLALWLAACRARGVTPWLSTASMAVDNNGELLPWVGTLEFEREYSQGRPPDPPRGITCRGTNVRPAALRLGRVGFVPGVLYTPEVVPDIVRVTVPRRDVLDWFRTPIDIEDTFYAFRKRDHVR
jgi:hypothetical protein